VQLLLGWVTVYRQVNDLLLFVQCAVKKYSLMVIVFFLSKQLYFQCEISYTYYLFVVK